MKYICCTCKTEHIVSEGNPIRGIEPGTEWDDIPDDYRCHHCGTKKDGFRHFEKDANQSPYS